MILPLYKRYTVHVHLQTGLVAMQRTLNLSIQVLDKSLKLEKEGGGRYHYQFGFSLSVSSIKSIFICKRANLALVGGERSQRSTGPALLTIPAPLCWAASDT